MDKTTLFLFVAAQVLAAGILWQRAVQLGWDPWASISALWNRPGLRHGHACGHLDSTDMLLLSDRVVMPHGTGRAAVHVQNGIIDKVSVLDEVAVEVAAKEALGIPILDYTGFVLSPGIIDIHVHMNEPGREDWEGIDSATAAAAAGGVTTVVDMPLNSAPCTTTADTLTHKMQLVQQKARVDVGLWAGLVPDTAENHMLLQRLIDIGALGFKCFMSPSGINDFPNVSAAHIEAAVPLLLRSGVPLFVHAELVDSDTPSGGNARDYTTYLQSRPKRFEQKAVTQLLDVLRKVGKDVDGDGELDLPEPEKGFMIHVAHLSNADLLPALQAAKQEGLPLSVETCPHYLAFAAEDIGEGATEFKCAPPIRKKSNQQKLWQGIKDGHIDLISSDHSPAPASMKQRDSGDFMRAWGGIAGLQYTLPAVWTYGQQHGLTPDSLAALLSEQPAVVAGLDVHKGLIEVGYDADFVIWNPDAAADTSETSCLHKHKLTPYRGLNMTGKVQATMVRGQLVFDAAKGVASQACGRLVLRSTAATAA